LANSHEQEHLPHPVKYNVAVSLDGYITGQGGDISAFAHGGPVVDDYMARLATYQTALMGHKTYEFGYGYGLMPGQNPYPHMKTVVFSKTVACPDNAEIEVRRHHMDSDIHDIARAANGPIYQCGGRGFAGWMRAHELIAKIILKRAPCVLGGGVSLFGSSVGMAQFSRLSVRKYDNGYLLGEFTPR